MSRKESDPVDVKCLMERRKSFGIRAMLRITEHYRTAINETLRATGFPDFSDAHRQVLFNLEIEGNRITTLAARARISVQAMGKLVKDLEQKDYVERRPHPEDGRAVQIVLTEKGARFFDRAVSVIAAHEAEIEGIVGNEAWRETKERLLHLVDGIDPLGF